MNTFVKGDRVKLMNDCSSAPFGTVASVSQRRNRKYQTVIVHYGMSGILRRPELAIQIRSNRLRHLSQIEKQ